MCYASDIIGYVVDILKVVIWPVLLVFVLLYFQHPLKDLLGRIEEVGQRTIKFGKAPGDLILFGETPAGSANLFAAYWLGHDFMWTRDMILRGAPKEYILHGLKRSLHHLGSLGLKEGSEGTILTELKVEIAGMPNREIDKRTRNKYAKKFSQVVLSAGKALEDVNLASEL